MSLVQRFIRGMTKNHAQLNDADEDEKLHVWQTAHPPAEVIRHLTSWVRTRRQWKFEGDPPSVTATEVQLLHRSAVFRFVDDVRLQITTNGAATTIHAHSRSRIGKGDLGQNRRNLIDLRNGIPDLK